MAWVFPSLEVIRQAVRSGAVPPAVARAGATISTGTEGELLVEPKVAMPRPAAAALKELGVRRETVEASGPLQVSCWAELFPLTRSPIPPAPDLDQPVLFVITDETQCRELTLELIRLGCQLISGRIDVDDSDVKTWLVRVVGAPYYSLLRGEAFDHAESVRDTDTSTTATALRVYKEQAPGVWVRWGWMHPLAQWVKVSAPQCVLIDSGVPWQTRSAGGFRNLLPQLDFTLEEQPVPAVLQTDWPRWQIPLRLVEHSVDDLAAAWIVTGEGDGAADEVSRWLRSADPLTVQQLTFVLMSAPAGSQQIVLRLRPGSGKPPVLNLQSVAYGTHPLSGTILIPCGLRLEPQLPREIIERVLDAQAGHLTWLTTTTAGTFETTNCPLSSFRPLVDWVDYLIERSAPQLEVWSQSFRLEYSEFVVDDRVIASQQQQSQVGKDSGQESKSGGAEATLSMPTSGLEPNPSDTPRAAEASPKPRKNWVGRLLNLFQVRTAPVPPLETEAEGTLSQADFRAIEQRFMASKVPLDSPRNTANWLGLARMYGSAGRWSDAASCLRCLLWSHPRPASVWWRYWLKAELRGQSKILSINKIVQLVQSETLRPALARMILVQMVWSVQTGNNLNAWRNLQPQLRRLLQASEGYLPLRIVWWSWLALAELTGGDVLGLAQARDRCLARLHQTGYRPEQELPSLFRRQNRGSESFLQERRQHWESLKSELWNWMGLKPGVPGDSATIELAQLILLYGQARLEQIPSETAGAILRATREQIKTATPDRAWLLWAFLLRIQQVQEQLDPGPWPAALQRQLDALPQLERYRVDRLRQQSTVLEPVGNVDPFRRWSVPYLDELHQELALLAEMQEPAELSRSIHTLKERAGRESPPRAARILATALELSVRVGESTTTELLEPALRVWEELPDPFQHLELLKQVLFAVGHFEVPVWLEKLLRPLEQLPAAQLEPIQVAQLAQLLQHLFPALQRFGRRQELVAWLERLEQLVASQLQAGTPSGKAPAVGSLTRPVGKAEAREWEWRRVSLTLAEAWFQLENPARAWPILEGVQSALKGATSLDVPRVQTAVGLLQALGQAPANTIQPRLLSLLEHLPPVRDPLGSSTQFSLGKLHILEAAVTTYCGTSGQGLRQREARSVEDEFLIRRRLHADLRQALEKSPESEP